MVVEQTVNKETLFGQGEGELYNHVTNMCFGKGRVKCFDITCSGVFQKETQKDVALGARFA